MNFLKKYICNNTVLQFIEMFQYTFIVLILSIIVSLMYSKLFYYITLKGDSLLTIFSNLLIDTYLICIAIFYIRQIALLIPSIPKIINPRFKEHTTFDAYTVHLAAFVALVELLPFYFDHFHKLHQKLGII